MSTNNNFNNLAYPYVKAIFAIAVEKNNLQAWQQLLKLWTIMVQVSPQFFATNHVIRKEKQLELFLNICTATSVNVFQAALNLLKILIEKQQLPLLPRISTLYQKLCAKHEQILIVRVVCATELEEQQKQALKASLETRLKSQLQMSYEIDANLISGMKIYFDDQVIDLSISGQLQRLRRNFKL